MHMTREEALALLKAYNHEPFHIEHGEIVGRVLRWYAERLCVTPKYLSEVSKRVSGQAAIYWITRYTALDIARQLRTTNLTIDQLSDLYNFGGTNYFIRYVQKNLGASPSSFRE